MPSLTGAGQSPPGSLNQSCEKTVNVCPVGEYCYWQQVLGAANFPFGSCEKISQQRGYDGTEVCLGDIFQVGSALIQVSQPRHPRWGFAQRCRREDLVLRVQDRGRAESHFSVIREGSIQACSRLMFAERPFPTIGSGLS
jgi:MOSC domain-containing protein YiiM